MQGISDSLNEQLSACFPFIDNFFGFSKDLAYKSSGKDFIIPVGCNIDPDQCDDGELEYLLPESTKQGIVFYDNLKVAGTPTDLGCNTFLYTYTFDVVVWVNTKKVIITPNQSFCSNTEALYFNMLSCLSDDANIMQYGLYSDYMRSSWKFKDCVKYLNSPYIAFRFPLTYQYELCVKDVDPINYTTVDC